MTNTNFEKISVFGLGYIGLPTAAMIASFGVKTVGVDVNPDIVSTINNGAIHFVEPDLDRAVQEAVASGDLRATLDPEAADAFLVTVPTPFSGDDHRADLSYIRAAAAAIAKVLVPGNLVILESTSPVGTTAQMAHWMAEWRPDLTFPQDAGEESDIRIAYCPERVLPGKVMQELITNDRIVGGMTPACSLIASKLYKIFVTGECVVASNPDLAEMAKLTENSFRDVNIAFANELSVICHTLNIDVWELISLSNRHPRVNILQPGPGVGGHCIAVDPWFIVSSAPDKAALIKQARVTNDAKPDWVIDRVQYHMKRRPECDVIVYGVTFKPDIDDLRESPSLDIFNRLRAMAPDRVLFCDPYVERGRLPCTGIEREDAFLCDAVHVLLVDHSEFKTARPLVGKIVDFKGIWGGEV
jgi:UDP-N-acetyl-D-mannosaminuronic acid dehydrogenase